MKIFFLITAAFFTLTTASYSQSNPAHTTDPVEKAKGLQKQLSLNNVQTDKIAGIFKESSKKFEKIKTEENGNTNKMLTRIVPLRKETINKIKLVLTPKQTVKYDKLLQETKGTGGSGWGDGWGPTN